MSARSDAHSISKPAVHAMCNDKKLPVQINDIQKSTGGGLMNDPSARVSPILRAELLRCGRKMLQMYWPETIASTRLYQTPKRENLHHPEKENMEIAWMCSELPMTYQRKQRMLGREDEKALGTNCGRRNEGCWADTGHTGKESSRQRELARSCASLVCYTQPRIG